MKLVSKDAYMKLDLYIYKTRMTTSINSEAFEKKQKVKE